MHFACKIMIASNKIFIFEIKFIKFYMNNQLTCNHEYCVQIVLNLILD